MKFPRNNNLEILIFLFEKILMQFYVFLEITLSDNMNRMRENIATDPLIKKIQTLKRVIKQHDSTF